MTSESKCERVVHLMRRTDKFFNWTDFYVGSTSLSLKVRLGIHRHHSKVCGGRLYTRMREAGAKNWEIISLETVPLCDRKEILVLEGKYIEELKPDLNKNFPIKENNERNRERARKYYLKSLEEKRYYCRTCEKAFGTNKDLERHFSSLKHSHACMNFVD